MLSGDVWAKAANLLYAVVAVGTVGSESSLVHTYGEAPEEAPEEATCSGSGGRGIIV